MITSRLKLISRLQSICRFKAINMFLRDPHLSYLLPGARDFITTVIKALSPAKKGTTVNSYILSVQLTQRLETSKVGHKLDSLLLALEKIKSREFCNDLDNPPEPLQRSETRRLRAKLDANLPLLLHHHLHRSRMLKISRVKSRLRSRLPRIKFG